MSEKIIRLKSSGESEVIVKKSRFLGITCPVSTPEEAQEFVNSIKKKYYDARHNCYAYVIGEKRDTVKFSDDGEPGGTAGKPMLDVLMGSGITDVALVVTRYFGGTLLGTGGLVRAYSDAAKEAIENSETYTVEKKMRLKIEADYASFTPIERILKSKDNISYETEYSDKIVIIAGVPLPFVEEIKKSITELTSGKALLNELEEYIG